MTKLRTIGGIWKFLYMHERRGFLWVLAMALTGFYAAGTAWLLKKVIDSIVSHAPLVLGLPAGLAFGIAYGVITILHAYLTSKATSELLTIRDNIGRKTDQMLMSRLARPSDIHEFEIPETQDRIRLASAGAKAFPTCFSGTVDVLQQVVTIFGLSLILIRYDPVLIPIIFLPAVPLFYAQLKIREHTFAGLVHKSPSYRRLGYLVDLFVSLEPAKEMRMYRNGDFFMQKYRETADQIFSFSRGERRRSRFAVLFWGMIACLGIGSAYIYIIHLAIRKTISIGDVAMYGGVVFYAGGAIRSFIQSISSLWNSLLEVSEFYVYIDSPTTQTCKHVPLAHGVRQGRPCTHEWMLNQVSFAYPGRSDQAVHNISLQIREGEKVAIVGLNGAGKSTLMKLMLRLLDPQEGTIRFRGADLTAWDVSALRRHFAVVFQDFMNYKLTLYENIALGAMDRGWETAMLEKEAVFRAAMLTGADDIANASPLRYNMQLGKEFAGAIDLSGGQWHRVALARGLVRNASVVFLDEPSASLDTRTERMIFDRVISLLDSRTAILISHRLSITPAMDRIFVLDGGQLIEEGSHASLLRQGGKYAEMYTAQSAMYSFS